MHCISIHTLNSWLKHLYSLKSFWVWCDKLCTSAFGNYLLFFSSSLQLSSCQVGWGQMHIFRFLQKYLQKLHASVNLLCSRIFFWTLPQMCGLTQSCNPFFYLRAWFLLWYTISAVRPFIKTCVSVQIMPIQLDLPQVNFTWSVVTSTCNMNALELNFSCPG